jgi:hypothetical protein
MAEATVKRRDPLRSALFDLFTLGIYGFFWHYATNRDLAERGVGDNPTASFLAAFPGVLVLVPFFVSTYNTANRVNTLRRRAGLAEDVNAGLATAAAILYPIAIYYLQKRLNEAYDAG